MAVSTPEEQAPGGGATDATGGESLEALTREASRIDGAEGEAAASERREVAVQVVSNNAAELLAGLMLARGMAFPILPKRKADQLAQVWTDEVLESVSQAGAQVLALHGVQFGSMLGRYAPYIALIAALAPPMLATKAILAAPEPKPADVC
jgi:hypothetical protein